MFWKLFFIIGFLLGFVAASHWDGGRKFVQDISPVYMTPLQKSVNDVVKGIEKTGENVKKELKQKISQ